MSSFSSSSSFSSHNTIDTLRRVRDEALCRCKEAGKRENYQLVLIDAEEALRAVQHLLDKQQRRLDLQQQQQQQQQQQPNDDGDDGNNKTLQPQKEDRKQDASANGYKGYALMKLGKFATAIYYLERSQQLRQSINIASTSTGPTKKKESSIHQEQSRSKSPPKGREFIAVEQALKHCYQQIGQNHSTSSASLDLPEVIKYPRTTHLFDSGGSATTSDDLILSDLTSIVPIFCTGHRTVIVEEKVDGANIGISMCPTTGQIYAQNRSHYVSDESHVQFHKLSNWMKEYREILTTQILRGGECILYGEWVTARHTIPYKKLPNHFIAFDLYNKVGHKFYSRSQFHTILQNSGISVVPTIQSQPFGPYPTTTSKTTAETYFRQELLQLLETKSVFRNDNGTVEGVVLRIDEEEDEDGGGNMWLQDKFKIVRPDFVQGINEASSHWLGRQIEKQTIDYEFAETYLQDCYVFASTATTIRRTQLPSDN